MEDNAYETRTNLMSCENTVEYLWLKCTSSSSSSFKPENADKIVSEVSYGDSMFGSEILSRYVFEKDSLKNSSISKSTEYSIDFVSYRTLSKEGKELSSGELCLIHQRDHKLYLLYEVKTEEDRKKHLILLVKCSQKKRLLESFPTEVIKFF